MKNTASLIGLASLLLVSCAGDTAAPSVAYTNDPLGFSVNVPETVTVSDCSPHEQEGKTYVLLDTFVTAPLLTSAIPNGVIFHPEWYMEPSGEVETSQSRYYARCDKKMIEGAALTDRTVFRDFPFWTIVSDAVASEKDLPASVIRRCTTMAKLTDLQPSTQPSVQNIGIDVDMAETNDSSAAFCPDLLTARYVPATGKAYYIYSTGPTYIDDRIGEHILESLRFEDAGVQ